jgi:ribonuclease D
MNALPPPRPFLQALEPDQLNALPIGRYEGPVHLVRNDAEARIALAALAGDTLLGFDTESRPSFRKGENHPVALVQLAGACGVWLFQLRGLADPAPLAALLGDAAVRKVGVATADDGRKLRETLACEPAGFLDLSAVARRHGLRQPSLRQLAAILLGIRIPKGTRLTNWARLDLTPAQVAYAATDAWIARQVYLRLRELGANI